jgi:hypothetical protein
MGALSLSGRRWEAMIASLLMAATGILNRPAMNASAKPAAVRYDGTTSKFPGFGGLCR